MDRADDEVRRERRIFNPYRKNAAIELGTQLTRGSFRPNLAIHHCNQLPKNGFKCIHQIR